MAIHTDTVLVVALVGSLGYYLFFYQDDPKVQAEKAAKIQTSVAKQRLQRASIERALRTFQGRAEKIGPKDSLGGLRQDFINLRDEAAQLAHKESEDKIVALAKGDDRHNSMIEHLNEVARRCTTIIQTHPDTMEEDTPAKQTAALNENVGRSFSNFPEAGQFNVGRGHSVTLTQFSNEWAGSRDGRKRRRNSFRTEEATGTNNDDPAFVASDSKSSKDVVANQKAAAEAALEGNTQPSREAPERLPERACLLYTSPSPRD